MSEGFWKGASYSALIGTILNVLLYIAFKFFQSIGVIKAGVSNENTIVIGIYALVFLIYTVFAFVYYKRQSEKNLSKLKADVEKITKRKVN